MESKKLLMIHIPKCAGVTMNQIIGLNNPKFFGNHYGHHHANFIKNVMGDKYKNYTSFCIIRNPWDKLWSSYNFMKSGSEFISINNNNLNSFQNYISNIYNTKKYLNNTSKTNGTELFFHKQSNWIMDNNGNQIIDIIGKFEDLPSLVKTIENDFNMNGLSEKLKNTHSNRTKKINYQDAYTDDIVSMVREMYVDDIKLGDYEF